MKKNRPCIKRCLWYQIVNSLVALVAVVQLTIGLARANEVIIGFGDSVTAGYPFVKTVQNGSTQGGYEPPLQSLLNSAGRAATVLNYGHGAENTAWGLNRIDSVIAAHPGSIMLIMEGTNDAEYGLSMETTIANLNVMMDKCRAQNVVPIIATITPNDDWKTPSDIPNYYNPTIINLAADKGIQLADQYSTIAANWSAYKYDLVHLNQSGYNAMANVWFNALQSPQPASPAPSILYLTAKSVGETTATLFANVNPNGDHTTCYFEYGLSSVYENKTATLDAGSGYYSQSIAASLSGLKPSATYSYRMVAQNSRGTKESSVGQFITTQASAPYASTTDSINVTNSEATLNATINPYGFTVTYYFEYGVSTNYGAKTATYSAAVNSEEQAVSVTVEDLDKETEYHFRVVIQYNSTLIYGEDKSLLTLSGGSDGGSGCFISSILPGSAR